MSTKLSLVLFLSCVGLLTLVLFSPDQMFRRGKSEGKQSRVAERPAKSPQAERESRQQAEEEEVRRNPPITQEPGPTPPGMVWIPGGTFLMGSPPPTEPGNPDRIKPDEFPQHRVTVDGFWMDITPVTNAQFARFVEVTGYVTSAEKTPRREDFLGIVPDINEIPEENLVPSALIFNPDFDREKFRDDYAMWEYQAWKLQPGADWKHPTGPDSSIEGLDEHPVVNVTYEDCLAYCQWAGKRLATEAEWEYACRGGHEGRKFPWGDELHPNGQQLCNYWQGTFPTDRQNLDGYQETSPVRAFPPNDYGLYDMAGNVWEWVNDYYRPDYYRYSPRRNPTGPDSWLDPGEPLIEKRVTRGGSFLCNTNNCTGYRCAARMRSDVSTAAFHTGFRCVIGSGK